MTCSSALLYPHSVTDPGSCDYVRSVETFQDLSSQDLQLSIALPRPGQLASARMSGSKMPGRGANDLGVRLEGLTFSREAEDLLRTPTTSSVCHGLLPASGLHERKKHAHASSLARRWGRRQMRTAPVCFASAATISCAELAAAATRTRRCPQLTT